MWNRDSAFLCYKDHEVLFEQLTPRGKQAVVLQGSQIIKAQHFTEGKVLKGAI